MTNECGNCKFWNEVKTGRKDKRIGLCRFNPPLTVMVGQGLNPVTQQPFPVLNGFFPETRPDIWCGKHEPAEVVQRHGKALMIDADAMERALMEMPAEPTQ